MNRKRGSHSGRSALRIHRGSLRGQNVFFADRPGLRPSRAAVREAVCSMIADLSGSHGFLDCCAGSGIMAFSALSMGFSPVIARETDTEALRQLTDNRERLGVDLAVQRGSTLILTEGSLPSGMWVLFADPPYEDDGFHRQMLATAGTLGAIAPGSLYLAEMGRDWPGQAPLPWREIRQRRYGRTRVVVFEKDLP